MTFLEEWSGKRKYACQSSLRSCLRLPPQEDGDFSSKSFKKLLPTFYSGKYSPETYASYLHCWSYLPLKFQHSVIGLYSAKEPQMFSRAYPTLYYCCWALSSAVVKIMISQLPCPFLSVVDCIFASDVARHSSSISCANWAFGMHMPSSCYFALCTSFFWEQWGSV